MWATKIQHVLDREQEIARQHLRQGNKDRALVALRRRKYQESLLTKTDSQLQTLEQLVSDIEFSLVQVSVMHGLKQGNEVLKQIHKEMNPESVEKLLEETAEARAYQRVRRPFHLSPTVLTHHDCSKEIDDMLANSLTMDEEDAVQAELLQLQAEAVSRLPFIKHPLLLTLSCSHIDASADRGRGNTGAAICASSCAITTHIRRCGIATRRTTTESRFRGLIVL